MRASTSHLFHTRFNLTIDHRNTVTEHDTPRTPATFIFRELKGLWLFITRADEKVAIKRTTQQEAGKRVRRRRDRREGREGAVEGGRRKRGGDLLSMARCRRRRQQGITREREQRHHRPRRETTDRHTTIDKTTKPIPRMTREAHTVSTFARAHDCHARGSWSVGNRHNTGRQAHWSVAVQQDWMQGRARGET